MIAVDPCPICKGDGALCSACGEGVVSGMPHICIRCFSVPCPGCRLVGLDTVKRDPADAFVRRGGDDRKGEGFDMKFATFKSARSGHLYAVRIDHLRPLSPGGQA
jgi:hypothetical protein